MGLRLPFTSRPSVAVLLTTTLLAFGGGYSSREAAAQFRQIGPEQRSVHSRNDRLPDELDRPRVTERHSHRGWEVRNNRGVVIATTSVEDARRVAALVGQTWATMDRFADGFTQRHRHPDFGLSAVQVFIDNEPPKDRDLPLQIVTPGAFENRIQINVSPGRPALAEQVPVLRAAVAQVYLHVSEFDKLFPEWVSDGMVQAAVLRHEGMEGLDAIAKVPDDAFRGDQWKRLRVAQDRLANRAPRQPQAAGAEMVPFLIFGDDAVRAPALFAALAKTVEQRERAPTPFQNQVVRERALEVDTHPTPVDEFALGMNETFRAWSANPDLSVPQFQSTDSRDPDVLATERELFVVLKLAQRLTPQAGKAPDAATGPKVVEYKVREAAPNRNVVRNGNVRPAAAVEGEGKPAVTIDAALVARKAKTQDIHAITDLISSLNELHRGTWCTVDSDGGLLYSTDKNRWAQFIGQGDHYRASWEEDRWVWFTVLKSGQRLAGWLEPVKKDSPELVAKFELRR